LSDCWWERGVFLARLPRSLVTAQLLPAATVGAVAGAIEQKGLIFESGELVDGKLELEWKFQKVARLAFAGGGRGI
jgi:hypothetical protein